MAMKYHPDVNQSPDARRKFTEILEAYEYLSGMRRSKKRPISEAEKERFQDIMQKVAEERAKARYRQRVREFRKRREEEQNLEYQKESLIFIALILVGVGIWQGYKFYRSNDQP
ncbi:MAG: DnaJ domain-containing protein [Owenweeksia sp.]|nr:DnaJ domain-containing protein [Owenweeksia sp.]